MIKDIFLQIGSFCLETLAGLVGVILLLIIWHKLSKWWDNPERKRLPGEFLVSDIFEFIENEEVGERTDPINHCVWIPLAVLVILGTFVGILIDWIFMKDLDRGLVGTQIGFLSTLGFSTLVYAAFTMAKFINYRKEAVKARQR